MMLALCLMFLVTYHALILCWHYWPGPSQMLERDDMVVTAEAVMTLETVVTCETL